MTDPSDPWAAATEIADAVSTGGVRAVAVAEAALARIRVANPVLGAYTDITAERALAMAAAVDDAVAAGRSVGPLAGVPFAVKNLYDVAGLPTRAGSRINRERTPAAADAVLVQRMAAAGAVLLGTLNMGEYAYDFTGENAHDGPCRNPHDPTRMSGGSSSGCGAATAAGLAPVSLGSDTNGSLRVPASLCGVLSLKPTYGRLPRAGTFPFVDSLDHLGPFARTARDLAVAYDALQGPDASDAGCAQRRPSLTVPRLRAPGRLRVGLLDGWFHDNSGEQAREAVACAADALAPHAEVGTLRLDQAEAGRAAAYLITNAESADFHLRRLGARAGHFDPDTRDRFLAGALLPAAWIARARRVRHWWLERALAAFERFDLLLAPATPCAAPPVGAKTIALGGREVLLRPNLGLLATPFSCIGLPVATAPVFGDDPMPVGVQLVARPWHEHVCLQAAHLLEQAGASVARASVTSSRFHLPALHA